VLTSKENELMMKSTSILAGTAAVLVAVMGSAGAADAKGKGGGFKHGQKGGFHHKHFRHRHFYPAYPVITYGGCGYEKHMWWKTGRFYWKKRYYACKGLW
jgi:hypothetical protein